MIKKEKMYFYLISFVFLISFFSYEVHVYDQYYKIFQIILSAFIVLITLLFFKYENELKRDFFKLVGKQSYVLLMFGLMFGNTILGHLIFEYNRLSSIINVLFIIFSALFLFYLVPIIFKRYPQTEKKIVKLFLFLALFLSCISILMKLNHGHFLGYSLINARVASVYYDPNFLAMVLGVAFALMMSFPTSIFKRVCYCLVVGIAIILTGSRGTLLSLILAVFGYIMIFMNVKKSKKVMLFCVAILLSVGMVSYLYTHDFFRTYQGTNHRTDMWKTAIKASIKSPIVGYGYQAIQPYLKDAGFRNASTHNSFIDFLFAYGVLCFLLYFYLLFSIFWNLLKRKALRQESYLLAAIFMLINANTILYSFGGVGISSLLFTIILGKLNFQNNTHLLSLEVTK